MEIMERCQLLKSLVRGCECCGAALRTESKPAVAVIRLSMPILGLTKVREVEADTAVRTATIRIQHCCKQACNTSLLISILFINFPENRSLSRY